MSKKHFIALANAIKNTRYSVPWTDQHLQVLEEFCRSQNIAFNRARWRGYIRGENGPNGGKI